MYSVEDRESTRAQLIERARGDEDVVAAALTGSSASGDLDRWSDIDMVLGVRGELGEVAQTWTTWVLDQFNALHHWDLPSGPRSVIRVFLLAGCLEIDVTFADYQEFGPRGPQWQTIFGDSREVEPFSETDQNTVVGLGWHHLLHAYVAVQRGRWWQAEYWISQLRSHVITLACLRLGYPAAHAKGAHLLPDDVTTPLRATLLRTLDEPELRRALVAAGGAYDAELRYIEPVLAARLRAEFSRLESRE